MIQVQEKDHEATQAELKRLRREVADLKEQRQQLAKLAAKTPMFFNPLDAIAAETLRDQVLDGTVRQ